MRKFSTITGTKVSDESKVEVSTKINEEDIFKTKILSLMENFLSIRTYGPIDRYLRAGNIKIAGKELFLEALMDVLRDKSLVDETKILESLKAQVNDWEILDSKIDEVNLKILDSKINSKIKTHKRKILSLLSRYKDDSEMLMKMVQESCDKINKREVAQSRYLAAKDMSNDVKYPKELLSVVSEKFRERYRQLN